MDVSHLLFQYHSSFFLLSKCDGKELTFTITKSLLNQTDFLANEVEFFKNTCQTRPVFFFGLSPCSFCFVVFKDKHSIFTYVNYSRCLLKKRVKRRSTVNGTLSSNNTSGYVPDLLAICFFSFSSTISLLTCLKALRIFFLLDILETEVRKKNCSLIMAAIRRRT